MSEDAEPRLDLIEVIELARKFATVAGWGTLRVRSLKFFEEEERWICTVYLGAFNDQIVYISVDDIEGKVTSWTSTKPDILENDE